MPKIAYYRMLGFNLTEHIPFTRGYHIRCSSCETAVINGVPCHETGCPSATHECHGCNELIPARQRYCDDCA